MIDLVVDEVAAAFDSHPQHPVEVEFFVREDGSDEVVAHDRVLLYGVGLDVPGELSDTAQYNRVRADVVDVAKEVLHG